MRHIEELAPTAAIRALLRQYPRSRLCSLGVNSLAKAIGCTPHTARAVRWALSLHEQLLSYEVQSAADMRCPEAVFDRMRFLAEATVEHMYLLCLDTRSRLLGEPRLITKGDLSGTDCVPSSVFRVALDAAANSVILCHNHPTGDTSLSGADRSVTANIIAAGHLIGIPCVDHVVIGRSSALSMRRRCPDLWTN
jgi:DNA repair protein RadC